MRRLLLIVWAVTLLTPSNVSYANGFQVRISPDSLTFGTMEPGTYGDRHITIEETGGGGEGYVSIYASVSGSVASWVSLAYTKKLWAEGTEGVKVSVTVPENADYGDHSFDVYIQAGSYHKTIPCTLKVPGILALSPALVDVTITEDYGDNISLELANVCSTVSIYDIHFSADININKWLVLPSSSSLGISATTTKEVRVQVPAGESEPVGMYSGNIYAKYRYGPPTGISTSMTITILPSKQWYNEKYERINNLNDGILVYQIIEPYTVNMSVTDIKDEMVTLLDLTKEDISHFHDLTDPFLDESIKVLDELATHLVDTFEGWVQGNKSRTTLESARQSIISRIAYLQDSIEKETRIEYQNPMHKIHEQLSGIMDIWGGKIDKEIGETGSSGEKEQALGEEALLKAQDATLISPSLEYFTLAYKHFDGASRYYERIGRIAKAEECRQLANACWDEMQSLNQQMMDTRQRAADITQAGGGSYQAGQDTEFLTDSSENFNQAKIHFTAAAEEYRKIGTPECDDKAERCKERADDSKAKETEVEQLIKEKREDADSKKLAGYDIIRKGENAVLPFTALAHYNSAKEYLNEALNLYTIIGGDIQLEKDRISDQIQEVDEEIGTEKTKLVIYVSIISIIILVIIALFTRRYLRVISIRREMNKDKSLFRE